MFCWGACETHRADHQIAAFYEVTVSMTFYRHILIKSFLSVKFNAIPLRRLRCLNCQTPDGTLTMKHNDPGFAEDPLLHLKIRSLTCSISQHLLFFYSYKFTKWNNGLLAELLEKKKTGISVYNNDKMQHVITSYTVTAGFPVQHWLNKTTLANGRQCGYCTRLKCQQLMSYAICYNYNVPSRETQICKGTPVGSNAALYARHTQPNNTKSLNCKR